MSSSCLSRSFSVGRLARWIAPYWPRPWRQKYWHLEKTHRLTEMSRKPMADSLIIPKRGVAVRWCVLDDVLRHATDQLRIGSGLPAMPAQRPTILEGTSVIRIVRVLEKVLELVHR